MNDDLDRDARALLERARAAERPQPAEVRRRVRQAIYSTAPAGALIGAGVAAAHAAVGAAAAGKVAAGLGVKLGAWVAGGFLVALGAATTVRVTRSPSEPPQKSETNARRPKPENVRIQIAEAPEGKPATNAAPASRAAAPAPEPDLRTNTPRASKSAAAAESSIRLNAPSEGPSPRPSLAEEVRLLERVQKKLRDGDPETALEILHAEDVRFTNSQLRPDFEVARVLAWCELGSTEEARRAAEHFLTRNPGSPLADRVRRSCAFRAKTSKQEGASPSNLVR